MLAAHELLRAWTSMVFDPFNRFTPQDFVFKIARTQKEIEGFWALRRAIFCEEQKVFHGSDQDDFDALAIPIAGGECEYTRYGFRDLFVGQCIDIALSPSRKSGSRAANR